MIHRRSWSKAIQRWSERILVIAGVIGIGWIVYIIATSPMPYLDDTPLAPTACLDDDVNDVYINPDFTPWDELFPDGHEYGKDGEVIANGTDDGMPFSEPAVPGVDAPAARSAPSMRGSAAPMARMPWFYDGRKAGSTARPGCSSTVNAVSEPKSWHLIIIGLLSFAAWRWVGKEK